MKYIFISIIWIIVFHKGIQTFKSFWRPAHTPKNIKQTLSVSQRRKKQRASKRHYSNSYYDCYDYADGGDCDGGGGDCD